MNFFISISEKLQSLGQKALKKSFPCLGLFVWIFRAQPTELVLFINLQNKQERLEPARDIIIPDVLEEHW